MTHALTFTPVVAQRRQKEKCTITHPQIILNQLHLRRVLQSPRAILYVSYLQYSLKQLSTCRMNSGDHAKIQWHGWGFKHILSHRQPITECRLILIITLILHRTGGHVVTCLATHPRSLLLTPGLPRYPTTTHTTIHDITQPCPELDSP